MVRKVMLTMLMAVVTMAIQAQDEPEYRLEIGAGAGVVNYLGDYNASIFGELQPMGAVMARYKANPRVAVALMAVHAFDQRVVEHIDVTRCLPHAPGQDHR